MTRVLLSGLTPARTLQLRHARTKQTSFIYINPLTQIRLLIYARKCPKATNGRLRGGTEQSHIKGIGPASQLSSISVIFHLKRIAKHLALSTLLHLRLC